jgi:shikimate kinase
VDAVSESDTPRTDEMVRLGIYDEDCDRAISLCRQLERELAEARDRITKLETALNVSLAVAPDDPILETPEQRELYSKMDSLERELAEAREKSYRECADIVGRHSMDYAQEILADLDKVKP